MADVPFLVATGVIQKTSLLRRLQAQTLPDATSPLGKIAVNFEPVERFKNSSGFRML